MTRLESDRKQSAAISPADFFSNDAEKTKLNWFCFEFAMEIQNHIGKKLKKRIRKSGVSDEALAGFCVHYAKTMKPQIVARATGRQSSDIELSYLPIEDYFPAMRDKLVDALLSAAGEAWNNLTEMCVVCPTRCISERDRRADMFDDPDYYDSNPVERSRASRSNDPMTPDI